MKNGKKLTAQYCLHFDEDMASLIEKLSAYYQRNASEFLRLIITPVLINEYAKIMKIKHPENNQTPTLATFEK